MRRSRTPEAAQHRTGGVSGFVKGIVISLILTLGWVAAHIALFHVRRPEKMFHTLLILFSLTVPLYPVIYFSSPPDLHFLPGGMSRTPVPLGIVSGLILHLLLFFTYVEFFYYIARAVTLRLLVEMRMSGGRGVSLEEIQREYNVQTMVIARLDAMMQNGFVRRSGACFVTTPRGRRYARISMFFRRLINIDSNH